jgi:MFS transporter, PPP family, 3-phenylpropionic acid transporter
MAQTTELEALALVQPLHGFTFALLHLASMRLITDTVPSVMAGTAQTVYGLCWGWRRHSGFDDRFRMAL